MTTEAGLVRFDGRHFQNFTAKQFNLHSNRFGRILKKPGTTTLLALNGQQEILSIHQGKPIVDPLATGQLLSPFNSIPALQAYQRFLLGQLFTTDPGIWKMGDSTLMLTESNGIFVLDNSHYTFYQNGQLSFRAGYRQSRHEQFFIAGNTLHSFDKSNNLFTVLGPAGRISPTVAGLPQLSPGKKGRIISNPLQQDYAVFCYDKKVYLLRSKNGQLTAQRLIDQFDAQQEDIVSVWLDRFSGKLLLGSNTKGLFVFALKNFQPALGHSETSNEVYYAQAIVEKGAILTGQGMLFHPPDGIMATKLTSFPHNLTDKYNLLKDQQGYLWSKKDSTVFQWKSLQSSKVSKWLFPGSVTQIAIGEDQRTWVGLDNKTLHFISPKGNATYSGTQLPASFTCMVPQTGGVLWIGTVNGIYRYNIAGKQFHLIPASRNKHVRSIYIDGPRLWITTYGDGFFLLENDSWTSFPVDRQQYLLNTHCIAEDKHGFFWITTNNGLFQVAKNDLLSYARLPVKEPYYHHYNQDDGLLTNEFNGGCTPCSIVMPDGMFSFPTINGLVWFYPDRVRPVLPQQTIYIDRILLDNQEIPYTSTIEVPRNMKQLRMELIIPFLGNRSNLDLSYALTRQDDKEVWLPIDDNLLTLSTLPAGEYKLTVRKQEGFGAVRYSFIDIHLYVPKHWLLHPGPVVLILIILLSGLLLLYKFRTRLIRSRNMQLEKEVTKQTGYLQQALVNLTQSQQELIQQSEWQQKMLAVLSHDIKAPLRYLMLATDHIRLGMIQNNITAYQQSSKTVFEYSSRLYYTMDNLLRYIKTQFSEGVIEKTDIDLYEIIEDKISIFAEIAKESGTTIINHIPINSVVYNNQPLLAIIVHNLIDNAVKVTENGTITLSGMLGEAGFILRITDTGIGISQDLQQWINATVPQENSPVSTNYSNSGIGLYIVKDLVKLLGISLSVSSNGAGSQFQLIIPHHQQD
ncbi:MAG: ATP-binding protein [Pseudobacter sp.]|uniref:sensor histidine kinase n=1 Tax=Pseudobacter sp. TaxID=2045420 RepID=UPI003F80BB54